MHIPTPVLVVLAIAVALGFCAQASYYASTATPPTSYRGGWGILFKRIALALVWLVKRLLRVAFWPLSLLDGVWQLETLKNLLQALLLSGASLASNWLPKDSVTPAAVAVAGTSLSLPSGWAWESVATVAGFLLIGAYMAFVTHRAEKHRDSQAKAAHDALVAQNQATLQALADIQRELASLKASAAQTAADMADFRQKV